MYEETPFVSENFKAEYSTFLPTIVFFLVPVKNVCGVSRKNEPVIKTGNKND
jgi:hypothetical protein